MSVKQKFNSHQEGALPFIVADVAESHQMKPEQKDGETVWRGKNFLDPNGSQSHQFLMYPSGVAQDFKLGKTYPPTEISSHLGLSVPERIVPPYTCAEGSAKQHNPATVRETPTATYNYYDESGKFCYQILRFGNGEGKRISQRKPVGVVEPGKEPKWSYSTKDVRKVIYHLPSVIKSPSVLIVEGEKAVDYIRSRFTEVKEGYEIAVTCNPGGAKKWKSDYNEHFKGKRVFIVPDNDDVGRAHADMVATALLPVADSVRVYEPEGLEPKQGADDFLAKGFTVEQFIQMLTGAPLYTDPEIAEDGKHSTEFALDDIGNGERFAKEHGADLRFCSTREQWLIYKRGVWEVDTHGEAEARAKRTARNAKAEALKEVNLEKRVDLLKHASRLAQRGTRSTMIQDAAFEPSIVCALQDFDRDPYLFNCANGTLDLRNRTFREHRATDLLSLRSHVHYDPKATCDTWDACLERWIPDVRTQMYLQDSVGATLCGVAQDEFFNFLHGEGGNGKSRFFGAIEALMGSYWHKTQAETLMSARDSRKSEAPSPAILSLRAARLVTSHEIDDRHQVSAALLKDLTGRDPITARGMYEKRSTTFLPQFTLWLVGNSKPRITDTSGGMWRRVRLVEFAQPIAPHERDTHLTQKLERELPGILNWALDGWERVQQYGLVVPPAVDAATAMYRAEQDPLGGFLDECCELGPSLTVESKDLWQAWETWCGDNGESPKSPKFLTGELSRRKCEPFKSGSVRKIRGISLNKSLSLEVPHVSHVSLSEPEGTHGTDGTVIPQNISKPKASTKRAKGRHQDSEPYSNQ